MESIYISLHLNCISQRSIENALNLHVYVAKYMYRKRDTIFISMLNSSTWKTNAKTIIIKDFCMMCSYDVLNLLK